MEIHFIAVSALLYGKTEKERQKVKIETAAVDFEVRTLETDEEPRREGLGRVVKLEVDICAGYPAALHGVLTSTVIPMRIRLHA
jgi:hypothetical protein